MSASASATSWRRIVLAAAACLSLGGTQAAFAQAAPIAGTGEPAVSSADLLSPAQPGRPGTTVNPEAVAALPKDFKFVEPGKLTVATAASSPPISTFATDNRTVVGADPELARLVAEALGLELNIIAVAWADWPLGLISGKYDAVISNVAVTEERKEKFDFSTYRAGKYAFFVPNGSAVTSVAEPRDVAGLRVITASGTIQERILLEWDRLNREAGLEPVDFLYFDDEAAADVALQSGRADAVFNPNGSLSWTARERGTTRKVGTVSPGWPKTADMGLVSRKGAGLAEPFAIAINGVIADGSYGQMLFRWGFLDEELSVSQINPPGLPKF